MHTPKPNDELIKLRTKSSGVVSSLTKGKQGITIETSSSVKPKYRNTVSDNRFIERMFAPVAGSTQSKPKPSKPLVKKIKDNRKNMAG